MANPVLAEATRGNWIENRHRGAFCVSDASGKIIASIGDVSHGVFPRSAIKSMQALALFRSGAAEKFDLEPQSIAIACASHLGEEGHIEVVRETLEKIGCAEADLECGIHPPSHRATRNAMREAGIAPGAIHNNCSGKHAGMLAVARALGAPIKGYIEGDHPVQKLVRACVEDLMGTALTTGKCGTDGCSIPTWAAPLHSIARGFARMSTGSGLAPEDKSATQAIVSAATTHPFLVGGSEAFDSEAMKLFGSRLMSKGGAEGVFCGAIVERGWGYALKCDDGNMAAAETMVAALLLGVAEPDEKQRAFLEGRCKKTIRNWRKFDVGTVFATKAAMPKVQN
ncbi:MAG TPA: asparaginase [Devosia sp.]|nr:asparaginase [Devosia sp.]